MQKVLRLNILKRNNELKRSRKQLFKERKDQEKDYERWAATKGQALRDQRRTERRERREDWINGELAANRNVGVNKGKLGTVHPTQINGKEIPGYMLGGPQRRLEGKIGTRTEWEGIGNEWNIIVGDRVCVIRGVEGVVGQIGVVKDVSPEKGELTVADTNMADIALPEYMPPSQRLRKLTAGEIPLKFSDVRLVVALEDPDTGRRKDVIVRHIRGGAPHFEREYGSNVPRHTRYIAGEDIEIDWPEPEIQEREREMFDTPRQMVEDETYLPSILTSPMPPGVENELMNQYDRKRFKHDTQYVTRKIVEDARSAWYEQRKLATPAEMHREKRAEEERAEQEKMKSFYRRRTTLRKIIKEEQARVS